MKLRATAATAKVTYQIKITLKHIEPMIWRRLLVPAELNLEKFHWILQMAMGWQNIQLFKFRVNNRHYTLPDFGCLDEAINARNLTLRNIMPVEKQRISYVYGENDGWEHEILLEKIMTDTTKYRRIVCLEGERACPPEDCGGILEYQEILAALDALMGEENKEFILLVNGHTQTEFDLNKINRKLKKIKL
jgi:hypothetical protein